MGLVIFFALLLTKPYICQTIEQQVCTFNTKCRCWTEHNFRHVNCANDNKTDIPNIPPETDLLNINSNHIEVLEKDTFDTVTRSQCLNYINESLDLTVFIPLQSLLFLNLKHQEILNILPGKMIRKLYYLRNLEDDLLSSTDGIAFGTEFSSLTHLTLLKAGICKLEVVNNDTFNHSPNLELIH